MINTSKSAGDPLAQYFSRCQESGDSAYQLPPTIDLSDIFFVGNEKFSQRLLSIENNPVYRAGGDVVGCGVSMILHLAHLSHADRLIVLDNDPVMTKVFWPLIVSLFDRAPTRAKFIDNLLFTSPSELDESNNPADKGPLQLLQEAFKSFDKGRFKENIDSFASDFASSILRHIGGTYKEEEIALLYRGFADNLHRRIKVQVEGNEARVEDYHTDESWPKVAAYLPCLLDALDESFLKNDSEYQWMRNFILSNKLLVVTADIMTEDLDRVLNQLNVTKPSIIYIDNLPIIYTYADKYQEHLEGMLRIQSHLGPDSTLVTSVYYGETRHVMAYPLVKGDVETLDLSKDLAGHQKYDLHWLSQVHAELMVNFHLIQDSPDKFKFLRKALEGTDIQLIGWRNFYDVILDKITERNLSFPTRHAFWHFVHKELALTRNGRYTFEPPLFRLFEAAFNRAGVIRELKY